MNENGPNKILTSTERVDEILDWFDSLDDFDSIQRELSRRVRIADEKQDYNEYHRLQRVKRILFTIASWK